MHKNIFILKPSFKYFRTNNVYFLLLLSLQLLAMRATIALAARL